MALRKGRDAAACEGRGPVAGVHEGKKPGPRQGQRSARGLRGHAEMRKRRQTGQGRSLRTRCSSAPGLTATETRRRLRQRAPMAPTRPTRQRTSSLSIGTNKSHSAQALCAYRSRALVQNGLEAGWVFILLPAGGVLDRSGPERTFRRGLLHVRSACLACVSQASLTPLVVPSGRRRPFGSPLSGVQPSAPKRTA